MRSGAFTGAKAAAPARRLERRSLAGAPGLLLSLAGGAVAGLAHPPFGAWPALAGFALVLHALDAVPLDRRWRAAFARGWAAGFGYFLVGTWWVGEAFLVDVAAHGWQAPFAVVLLPVGLGLFWGAAGLAYRRIAPPHAGRVLVFAAVWSLAEWLRGHVLTGFPWDLPGEAWKAGSAPSQAAALLGAYGLTVLTLAIAAAAAVLGGRDGPRARILTLGLAAAALAALWIGGGLRLARPAPPDAALQVRVVQPDIPQIVKWTPGAEAGIVGRYTALTARPAPRRPDVVIWPEAAIPDSANAVLAPGAFAGDRIAASLAPGQSLLMGTYRIAGTEDAPRYYNSLLALRRTEAGLKTLAIYDKYRLVPFGEYLPMEGLMALIGFKKLAAVGESFSSGPRPTPISPAGLPRLQPLICYESLFPGFTTTAGGRPSWIVNVSNDAWFGRTSGPLQHLNLASYRAIEEGLPLVRATPTGVSAVVDGYGRVRASLGLGASGVIDSPLPAMLAPTPYTRWRDTSFWLFCVMGLAFTWRGRGPQQ